MYTCTENTASHTVLCTLHWTLHSATDHWVGRVHPCSSLWRTTHYCSGESEFHCIMYFSILLMFTGWDVHWVDCNSIAQRSRRKDGRLGRDFIQLTHYHSIAHTYTPCGLAYSLIRPSDCAFHCTSAVGTLQFGRTDQPITSLHWEHCKRSPHHSIAHTHTLWLLLLSRPSRGSR